MEKYDLLLNKLSEKRKELESSLTDANLRLRELRSLIREYLDNQDNEYQVIKDHIIALRKNELEINRKAKIEEYAKNGVYVPEDYVEKLNMPVSQLELSARSSLGLERANIKYVYELVSKTEGELLRTKGMGRRSVNEIKVAIDYLDLHLNMKIDKDFRKKGY